MYHLAGRLLLAVLTLSFSVNVLATKYVPISVGDITIIIPVNEAPVSADDSYKFNQSDTSRQLSLPVLENDWDEDFTTATVTIASQSAVNSVTVAADGSLTYTVPANWYGTDTITYQITDEKGEVSGIATVTLTINGLPVAEDKTAEILTELMICDSSTTPNNLCFEEIDLLQNATDPENQALSIVNLQAVTPGFDFIASVDHDLQSQYGLARLEGGTLYYYPKFSFFESLPACKCDSFTYSVSDGNGGEVSKTVTINLGNVSPIAIRDTYNVISGQTYNLYVLDNDVDPEGQALNIKRVQHVTTGNVAVKRTDAQNRQYVEFKSVDFLEPSPTFVYVIEDEHNETSSTFVTINVQPLGTTPSPVIVQKSGTYGTRVSVTILPDLPGDKVYYTTNGTEPTVNSTLYTGPIQLDYSETGQTIKAIGLRSHYDRSPVVSETYSFSMIDSKVRSLVANPHRVFPGGNVELSWQPALGSPSNTEYKLSVTRPNTTCGALNQYLSLTPSTRVNSSRVLNCDGTYQYHIEQCNSGKTVCGPKTSVEVRVSGFEPASVSANPSQIALGGTTTISWQPDPSQPSNATYKLSVLRPDDGKTTNPTPDELKSGNIGTSSVHNLSYEGTYVFYVQVCDSAEANCGERKRTFVTVGNGPIVEKFEWQPAEILVGDDTQFHWKIANVKDCTATTAGSGSSSNRAAEGSNTRERKYTPEVHVTKWYCTDMKNRRFPAAGFLEATRVVKKLGTPGNLREQ